MGDEAKVVVSIETILRNLDRSLKGLDRVEKRLLNIASIKVGPQKSATTDRAILSAQRLAQQQQKLLIQAQELANRQERARQSTERLTIAQERLAKAQERVTKAARPKLGGQADAHVKEFKIREAAIRAEQEKQQRAVESLQRQRSAALIQQFKEQEKAAERARRSVSTIEQSLSRLGGTLSTVGTGLSAFGARLSLALTAPLTALGVLSARNAVTLDSLKRGLTAIVGSADEAGRQLARLTEIAKLPGIGFQEAIQGSIRLQAVGFSAEVAEKALIQFSNAVALTGGGREELDRITVQLGQLSSKGKVLAQDLKPIIEAGPAVGRALREAFGTVNSEDIQALGLSSEQFIDKLLKQLEQLPRAAAGLRNTFDNFADAVFRASSAIGEAIVPVLTRLITFFEPIITRLADAFKQLSGPIQTLIVVFGGLAAAAGPTLFIFGQFSTGIGALIKAFVSLNVLGLVPTIKGFQLLGQVMRGTAALAAGQAATTAAAAAGWAALGGAVLAAVAVIGIAAVAIASYTREQKQAVAIDLVAAKARLEHINATEKELAFLQGLTKEVSLTADQQKRLTDLYEALTGAARGRILSIDDESKKLQALIEVKKEQIRLGQIEAQGVTAQLVENITLAIQKQTEAQQRLNSAKRRSLDDVVFKRSIESLDATERSARLLERERQAFLEVAEAAGKLTEAKTATEETAKALLELSRNSGISVEKLLEQAKAAKRTEAEINLVRKAIEELTESEKNAAPATDDLTDALLKQARAFSQLSDEADKAQKARETTLRGVVDFLRENTETLEDAERGLKNFIELFPELGAAIERQRKGKAIEQFLNELIGVKKPGKEKSGTSLRNAQEQFAKSIADVLKASAERQLTIERVKNERLLQQNESSFKLQIISYRQYLDERLRLTVANLRLEIREQEKIVQNALVEQARFVERAKKTGIPAPERIKAKAGASEAEEKLIKAETRILELQGQIRGAIDERDQTLEEAFRQQLFDIRQLEIEYAQLQGRIQDALNAETVERFRERLQDLSNAQAEISVKLERARHARDVEQVHELERAKQRNQREIESINNQIRLRDSLAELAAAEQLITNAKERRRLLEEELTFQIEFRGLAEEDAIRQRLAGEARLRKSLELSRSIITATIKQLSDFGITPPPQLKEFVDRIAQELKGLGELPFSEQFRLAEKEFNRINDERIRKIQDVERAVRTRDIAEIEGRILVRKINGDYVDDLEQQLALLKQIAEKSKDENLKRQAEDADETVKDAKDELVEFDRQLRSVSIDAFRDSFAQFFRDLRDNTENALQDFLNFLDRIGQRITDFIAENFADELFKSIFGGGGEQEGGIIGFVKRVLGIGGGEEQTTEANTTATEENTAAINALTTTFGGQAALGLTGITGQGGGGGGLISRISGTANQVAGAFGLDLGSLFGGLFGGDEEAATTAEATPQATTVLDALNFGIKELKKLTDAIEKLIELLSRSRPKQTGDELSGFVSFFGSLFGGFAAGDFLQPKSGGVLARIAEGGYPEAVLTTDPKYATRQAAILKEYLERTKGLFGKFKVPEFAEGGWMSPRDVEMNMLDKIDRAPEWRPGDFPEVALAGTGGSDIRLRQILVDDKRRIPDFINSPEGERVLVDFLYRNQHRIRRMR